MLVVSNHHPRARWQVNIEWGEWPEVTPLIDWMQENDPHSFLLNMDTACFADFDVAALFLLKFGGKLPT